MPPFGRAILILVDSKMDIEARRAASNIVYLSPKIDNVKILGPAHNDIAIVNKKHIYKILILTPKNFNIQKYVSSILSRIKQSSKINIKIDVDPYRT